MSVVHFSFDPKGNPVEEEKEEEKNLVRDAFGNVVSALGQGLLQRHFMGGGYGRLGRNQTPKTGSISKRPAPTVSSPYQALKTSYNVQKAERKAAGKQSFLGALKSSYKAQKADAKPTKQRQNPFKALQTSYKVQKAEAPKKAKSNFMRALKTSWNVQKQERRK